MNRPPGVLIIDDEEAICWGLERLLASEGFRVWTASSAEEGLETAAAQRPDLIILDVRLPGMDGLEALGRLRAAGMRSPVIVITAFGDLATAVSAMNQGAVDYLAKPFDLDQALDVVRRAVGGAKATDAAPAPSRESRAQLIGRSPAMQDVFKRIALAAPAEISVLITGESGTGKELVARAVHANSLRCDRPLLAVNLASLSPSLVESELFGHVRGAFTGADADRVGLLAQADGATVFLDEIGEIPPPLQVKLLRVLESHEFAPVGGSKLRRSDFRLIAATNRPLDQAILDGSFRRDLFFRLAGFEIQLRPLRERGDDVVSLAEHFLRTSAATPRPTEITEACRQELRRRSWPGNVRELQNAVDYAVLMARGTPLAPEHLPPRMQLAGPAADDVDARLEAAVRDWAVRQLDAGAAAGMLHEQCLNRIEPPLFDVVLERTNQNRAAAAEILGIHRATLRKKLN